MKISVRNIGLVSSLGLNSNELWNNILHSKRGLSDSPLYVSHAPEYPVGEIRLDNHKLAEISGIEYRKELPRSVYLSVCAISQIIKDLSISERNKTVLISSATVGGMDISEKEYLSYISGNADYFMFRYHSLGACTNYIKDLFGFSPVSTTISTACSSSANAIMLGCRLLKHKKAERVIVGGVDALSRFTMDGFKSLQILSDEFCMPFDKNRRGINLGEGAAYMLLEPARGREDEIIVSGYANAGDAYHQTAMSEEAIGPYLAMSKALESAGLTSDDISYLNAHGTSTIGNDYAETLAIDRIWGENELLFSSTKGFTGHTLGASGAIEAAICLLAMRNNVAPMNIGFNEGIEDVEHFPIKENIQKELINVMSNSFGFGGNCTSVIFSKNK